MFVVSESGQCTTLRNAINIERLSGFLENLSQLRSRDSIAQAQTGQPMNFRKRPQNDNFLARVPDEVIIVWDEAYFEFLADPSDTLRFVSNGRNVVILLTFSKFNGLTSLG